MKILGPALRAANLSGVSRHRRLQPLEAELWPSHGKKQI
ncbi:hypothetical protein PVAP13_8KG360102 [Panicum virgatum]|uniref:Uncharacterized protein n=1 Tax=Panicum virgatum TaxID=38727 RepID=A0A8T0PXW4_PANVG|nr:hypothetical protein PVAP13_8KG360102 [Panicum virgatum]